MSDEAVTFDACVSLDDAIFFVSENQRRMQDRTF